MAHAHQLVPAALDAAREALRDLDTDQIPADLRRVAAAGALTPPIAAALMKGLDRYEWLRERALEHLPDGARGGIDEAFLVRDPGWTVTLAGDAMARGGEDGAGRAAAAAAERDDAREQVQRLRRALKETREAASEDQRRSRRALEEERKARRAEQAKLARGAAGEEATIADLRERLAGAEAETAAVTAALQAARTEGREQRRARAAAEAELAATSAGGGWSAGDAEGLAAHLDRTARMSRPGGWPGPDEAAAVAGGSPLRLPSGVRPDGADAVEWLLSSAPPATVIVDGYNAAFLLTDAAVPAAARRRLELELSRLPILAAGRLTVIVVYDAQDPLAGAGRRKGNLEVVFTDGRSADEHIVELAGRLEGRRVVVSNDREVREGAEAAGAIGLWSSALADWVGRV